MYLRNNVSEYLPNSHLGTVSCRSPRNNAGHKDTRISLKRSELAVSARHGPTGSHLRVIPFLTNLPSGSSSQAI